MKFEIIPLKSQNKLALKLVDALKDLQPTRMSDDLVVLLAFEDAQLLLTLLAAAAIEMNAGKEAAELGRRMMEFKVAFVNNERVTVGCSCGAVFEHAPDDSGDYKRRLEVWLDDHEPHHLPT